MISTIWNNIFYYPVLNLLIVFQHLFFDNLGVAIIIVAVIFRLLLLPLMKRQTEMTRKMSGLKPQLDELQKKYKNNPEKLSQEQIKLYKKVGYNPLGCLFTFIPQILVLSVLIQVIRNVTSNDLNGVYDFVRNWISGGGDIIVNTKFIFWDLTRSYNEISEEFGRFSSMGLAYLVLSLFVGFSQFIMSKFTQIMQNPNAKKENKSKKKGKEDMSPEEMQQNMTKSFMLILPFTTVFIAISAPSALSLYWIVQSFMLVIQYLILDWDKGKEGVQNLITAIKSRVSKSK